MSAFKTMAWEEDTWDTVKRASSTIPPFAKEKSIKSIIEASEWAAKNRGSERVELCDVVRGVKQRAPEAYRDLFLSALREQGVNVDKT